MASNAIKSSALAPAEFTKQIIATLAPMANAKNAIGARAYMKNQFDHLGISTPARRAAIATLLRNQRTATAADLLRTARQLWNLPAREYQYVAIDLLGTCHRQLSPRNIPAILQLAQKKSWWDTVDGLASIVNRILRDDVASQILMDSAITHKNLWVRRIAMTHQLGWRKQADQARIFCYALALAHEKDFFIRKAIGWALRDYARHSPTAIRKFLRANRTTLSPLTQREAAKHL